MSEALPDGWSWETLGDLAEVVSGATPSKNEPAFWEGGNIPWATPSDITNTSGRVIFETQDKITERGLASCAARMLPKGSVLMTSRATLGEARVAGVEVTTNQGFKSLIPKSGVDSWYLFYQILHSKHRYSLFGKGTTFLEVNTKDTLRLPILRASSPQQRRIATILSTLDEVIEATEKLIDKHQKIKAGLMHDLFTRGLWTRAELDRGDHKGLSCESTAQEGQLRPSPEEAPGLYQDSPLGLIPKSWDFDILGQYITHIDSGWSPNCSAEPAGRDEWGVLKTTAVVWEGYRPTENKALPDTYAPMKSAETNQGDILITRKGPVNRVGVVAYVESTPARLIFPDTVFRTRLIDENIITSRFLSRALGCDAVQRHWWQRKVGLADAQVNLNHGILKSTPIPIPRPEEQSAICDRIGACEAQWDANLNSLSKLRQQKQGLMHDLLTGRVRVAAS